MGRKLTYSLTLGETSFPIPIEEACLLWPGEINAVKRAEKQLKAARQFKDPAGVSRATGESQRCMAVLCEALLRERIMFLGPSRRGYAA
jgi:hypothetical protein